MVKPPEAMRIFSSAWLLLNQAIVKLLLFLDYTHVIVEIAEESLLDLGLIGSLGEKNPDEKRCVMFPKQQNPAMHHVKNKKKR